MFRPDFMPRNWLKSPLRRSQVLVDTPEQYYLRPYLYEDKFPESRKIRILELVRQRITQREAAGHLVFENKAEVPVFNDLSVAPLEAESGFQLTVNQL